MKAQCLCLILFATSMKVAAEQPKSPAPHILEVAPQSTIRYSDSWRPSGVTYKNAKELVLVQPATTGTAVHGARILITTEQRLSHEDALQRLGDIAKSRGNAKVQFVEIGGWPAVVLEFMEPLPTRGAPQEMQDESEDNVESPLIQRAIVAVAAGTTVVHFDISLAPGTPTTVLQEAEAIASSSTFPEKGKPQEVQQSIVNLQHPIAKPPAPEEPQSPPKPQVLIHPPNQPAVNAGELQPGSAVSVTKGQGELEVVASSDAKDIVIAKNGSVEYSNNRGAGFQKTSAAIFGINDPTLGRGASGDFYLGTIAFPVGTGAQGLVTGCTNAVEQSADRGASFVPQGYSVVCPQSGNGICFPDQPHIAADSVNAVSGKDQIYGVWRNFTPIAGQPASCKKLGPGVASSSITCSTDNGVTFTSPALIPGAGDFPRIAVGKDGDVYVVTVSGNNVLLNRFSSCASGLVPAAGFPVTVHTLTAPVACPVAGLDRCNSGNTLSSPTVAPDPENAKNIYVSFAQSDGAGGEQIVTDVSSDRGLTFPKQTVLTTKKSIRRYMPWSCVTQGRAWVGWFDRSAAKAAGATDDLTDYKLGSTDGSNVGQAFNLTQNPDPQCATGWPCSSRSAADSTSCTVQPQFSGRCENANKKGSLKACDFNAPVCPTGETCQTGGGCPKYGDYNGIACAGDYVIAAWSSGTAPKGLPAANKLTVYSSVIAVAPVCKVSVVGCVADYTISLSCKGPNIGVKYTANCHDTFGEPTPCYAGFNGGNSVAVSFPGAAEPYEGSNSAEVCITDGPIQKCITVTAQTPSLSASCPSTGSGPTVPQCGEGWRWCTKYTPPHCEPDEDCLYDPLLPPGTPK